MDAFKIFECNITPLAIGCSIFANECPDESPDFLLPLV